MQNNKPLKSLFIFSSLCSPIKGKGQKEAKKYYSSMYKAQQKTKMNTQYIRCYIRHVTAVPATSLPPSREHGTYRLRTIRYISIGSRPRQSYSP
jgi:hypothetical protein